MRSEEHRTGSFEDPIRDRDDNRSYRSCVLTSSRVRSVDQKRRVACPSSGLSDRFLLRRGSVVTVRSATGERGSFDRVLPLANPRGVEVDVCVADRVDRPESVDEFGFDRVGLPKGELAVDLDVGLYL